MKISEEFLKKKTPRSFQKNSSNPGIKIFRGTQPYPVHPSPLNPAFSLFNRWIEWTNHGGTVF